MVSACRLHCVLGFYVNVALVCLCCGVTVLSLCWISLSCWGFLLLFSVLALCSCGVRELFVCVVSSFSGFGIRLCPLLCMNRRCVYHTLELAVFHSLARESLLLFLCGFLLETAVCLHGRLCEGFFWELEGGLLLVGLQYGVKHRVGEDVLAVVQVVAGS
jgi:hypothetical protein